MKIVTAKFSTEINSTMGVVSCHLILAKFDKNPNHSPKSCRQLTQLQCSGCWLSTWGEVGCTWHHSLYTVFGLFDSLFLRLVKGFLPLKQLTGMKFCTVVSHNLPCVFFGGWYLQKWWANNRKFWLSNTHMTCDVNRACLYHTTDVINCYQQSATVITYC